nr:MAG TPA: hypothetical protein [Caudoviricetes sp.]
MQLLTIIQRMVIITIVLNRRHIRQNLVKLEKYSR